MAALHLFHIAKIDTYGAYLHAKDIKGEIYVRPPASCMKFPGEHWKLFKLWWTA